MLRQLRSETFQKTLMIAVICLVVPSFVVFYGWQSSQSEPGKGAVAATVKLDKLGKVKIEAQEMDQARKLLAQRYQGYAQDNQIQLDPGDRERLITPQMTVREAINIKLLEEFGLKHGIVMTDEEVEKFIQENFPAQYRSEIPKQLAMQGISLETWIASVKFDLLMGRIRDVLSNQTRVTYYEAWLDYLEKNEKLIADYVKFPVSDYVDKVKVTDADLQKYFDANKEKFNVPDQYQYAYILVTKNDLRSSITVGEDEITSYYTSHQEDFRLPRSVKARQIFLAKPQVQDTNTTATDKGTTGVEAVRARATEIYQRAAKGEDFASLANQFTEEKFPLHSQDALTTDSDDQTTAGGNLGYNLETTANQYYGDEWTSAVFSVKPGSITEPIETRRGFYIVKVENIRAGIVQPLDKVRDIVRDKIVDQNVGPLFEKIGKELEDADEKYTTLEKVAEVTSQTVKISPKVDRDAKVIQGFGRLGDFEEAIRGLEKGGRSDVLTDASRHAVVELRQEFPAHTPTLDEVRDKVTQQYKNDKALEMAKNDAETLKAKSKNLETMRTAAVDMGLTVTVSSEFTRAEAANVFGMSEAFNKIANQVQKNEIRVTSLGKENEPAGYFVWYVADKIAPNQSDFRKELPAVTRALARDKAEVLINEFLRDRWQQERKQIDIGKAFR